MEANERGGYDYIAEIKNHGRKQRYRFFSFDFFMSSYFLLYHSIKQSYYLISEQVVNHLRYIYKIHLKNDTLSLFL